MLRKRRSYLQTDYTSQVTFPLSNSNSLENIDHVCCFEKESHLPMESHSPTVSSLKDFEDEPALLETKPLLGKPILKSKSKTRSPSLMEMEPDTMETKSVTESISSTISAIRFKSDPGVTERSQHENDFVRGCTDAKNMPDCYISEVNGQASPSQISLELDNTDICSPSHVSLALYNPAKEGSTSYVGEMTKDAKVVFGNIFETDAAKEKNIGSMLSTFSDDRILPYISQMSDAPWQSEHNALEHDLMNSEEDISAKGTVVDSSPESSKTRKLFSFSNATDLLFDLKGIADLFTSFPINSFKDGVVAVTKVPPCEEAVHLLTNQEPDYLMSEDKTNVKRSCSTYLSPSVCSPETGVDTLELCYDESDGRIDLCAGTMNSDKGSDGHSLHKENCILKAQSFIPKSADTASKGFRRKEVIENRCVELTDSEHKSPKMSKVGNCSCHLSYTNCFRPIDNDAEDEIIEFAETESPLPRTIPPRSGNFFFAENTHHSSNENTISLEHCDALDLLKNRIHDSPMGFVKLQDIVLDLQEIIEEYKSKHKLHPENKCAALFSEQKSSLCTVSRNVMSASQKVLIPDQTSEEIYQAVEETFFSLVHMTDVCLRFSSCGKCKKRQTNVQTNLCDLTCTYHQFVQAAKKAAEREDQELHLKLLSRQCTALTAAIFCLTQQFRTLISL